MDSASSRKRKADSGEGSGAKRSKVTSDDLVLLNYVIDILTDDYYCRAARRNG